MPDFNPNGFLQAYVSDFKVSSSSSSSSSSNNSNHNHNDNDNNTYDNNNNNNNNKTYNVHKTNENKFNDEVVDLTIILVASSADPEVFRELLQGKAIIEYVSNDNDNDDD